MSQAKMPEKLRQLTDKVYYLPAWERTDRPALGVVAGETGCLVVDAGNSGAHAELLRRECGALNLPPLRYLAITHWHWDHVFGAATLGLPTLAHRETARRIGEMASLRWTDEALDGRVRAGAEIAFCAEMMKLELTPGDREALVIRQPDASFEHRVEVDLDGVTCLVERVGGDHDPGSSVVFVPGEEVLFLGDCLAPDMCRSPWAYTQAAFLPMADKLLTYPVRRYVRGHGPPVSREELEARLAALRTIGELAHRHRDNRKRIRDRFLEKVGRPMSEDDRADLDAFLAGLRRPRPPGGAGGA
ncbi:MAG: MBL fold metallo-hydrolase [Bacillota bacterium]|nr:MBL fold metallo-hydrolase [Bacillota bacterium]